MSVRKRAIWSVLGGLWLALTASQYGILTSRKSLSYNGHQRVRCIYWLGWGRHEIKLFGRIGSEDVNCPNYVANLQKW